MSYPQSAFVIEPSHASAGAIYLNATDYQSSVIAVMGASRTQLHTYTVYGHLSPDVTQSSGLAFNGERLDLSTRHYLLGSGYRAYNPVLMRFNSPDSFSPFGLGGPNSYAAFRGNPIGMIDPSGHLPFPVTLTLLKAVSRFKQGLRSVAEATTKATSNTLISTAPVLKNAQWWEITRDVRQIKKHPQLQAFDFRTITNRADLDALSGPAYKYIFTNKNQLIVGNAEKAYFSHPVLEQFAARDSKIIAAGYIAKRQNSVIVSNHTGHYHKSAQGADTTGPVVNFLNSLGAEAKRIRDEGRRGIPLFYTP